VSAALPSEQTITDHLGELRIRLIWVAWILFGGFGACYGFSEKIFDFIRAPILPYLPVGDKGLHFSGVFEKFMAHVKVSFLAGVILTSPFGFIKFGNLLLPVCTLKKSAMLLVLFFLELFFLLVALHLLIGLSSPLPLNF